MVCTLHVGITLNFQLAIILFFPLGFLNWNIKNAICSIHLARIHDQILKIKYIKNFKKVLYLFSCIISVIYFMFFIYYRNKGNIFKTLSDILEGHDENELI